MHKGPPSPETRSGHILLLTLYGKSEVADLTPSEVKALRAVRRALRE